MKERAAASPSTPYSAKPAFTGENTVVPPALPCIVGPTGAGKTAAALALAQALAAKGRPPAVINADSRQAYADFPIITAQPSPKERSGCPHLLYGFLPTTQKLGAGEYARLASETLGTVFAAGGQPILAGGTGLYFKTLLQGIAPIPEIPAHISAHWHMECQTKGSQALYALLSSHDPDYAAKIHPNDRQRVTRALEVWQATGKTFSWWHAQGAASAPYRPIKVGVFLPMADLEPLLRQRIDQMLAAGALDEARKALEICPNANAPGWSGIGCREVREHLEGSLSLEECREQWYRNTRAYAKRQNTWFRADADVAWFTPDKTEELVEYMLRMLEKE